MTEPDSMSQEECEDWEGQVEDAIDKAKDVVAERADRWLSLERDPEAAYPGVDKARTALNDAVRELRAVGWTPKGVSDDDH